MPSPTSSVRGRRRDLSPRRAAGPMLTEDPQAIYDQAPCGYLSTTPDGRIINVNDTFLRWTSYTRDELLGRQFSSILSAGGRIYHDTHYAPMLRLQGSVREIALDVVTPDN